MKYFIDATIVDKLTKNVKQKINCDVNSETSVTLNDAKTELLGRIIIPRDQELANEKIGISNRTVDLNTVIEDRQIVTYKVYLQPITKA